MTHTLSLTEDLRSLIDFHSLPSPLKVVDFTETTLGELASEANDNQWMSPVVDEKNEDVGAVVVRVAISDTTRAHNILAQNLDGYVPSKTNSTEAFAGALYRFFKNVDQHQHGLTIFENYHEGDTYGDDPLVEFSRVELEGNQVIYSIAWVNYAELLRKSNF